MVWWLIATAASAFVKGLCGFANTLVVTTIAYFSLKGEKPWMAFYMACCGGVLVFNFLLSLFLVNKNFKK